MEKQVKIILIVGIILTILLAFFFPKPIGGMSSALCETDEGEDVICGHIRWCECLGFEGDDNFLFVTIGGGTTDVCFGWPINCT